MSPVPPHCKLLSFKSLWERPCRVGCHQLKSYRYFQLQSQLVLQSLIAPHTSYYFLLLIIFCILRCNE